MTCLSSDLSEGPSFEWPENFPRTDTEFFRVYEKFVTNQVARYNKVGRNLTDLVQEVWTKLIGTRFLQKFVQSAARRYPSQMSALEVCDYLGVSFESWKAYQWAYSKNRDSVDTLWMPDPDEGGLFGKKSLYSTESVFMLEELRDRTQKLKPLRPRKRPPVSLHGFKSYLSRAIHNFFANFCRSHDRHCKEAVLPAGVVVGKLSNGLFRIKTSVAEDPSPWEDSLSDSNDMTPEDIVDLVLKMRKAGVEPESPEGIRYLDLFSRGHSAEQLFSRKVRFKTAAR